jgi:septum site-determining protein MinC
MVPGQSDAAAAGPPEGRVRITIAGENAVAIDDRGGRSYQIPVEYDSDNRDFGLLTLVPELPIFTWLTRFDAAQDPARAVAGPAVLDLSKTTLHGPGLRALVQEMHTRGVRVIGLTGLDASQIGDQAAQLPPILSGPGAPRPAEPPAPPAPPPAPNPVSLVIEGNVRSGQRVVHPHGDVSVVGTVASGAEILAGGSVHIYGALRGRASAGVGGAAAQIFCHRLEAELLTINGIILAADDMDARFFGRAVRAVCEGDAISLRDLG